MQPRYPLTEMKEYIRTSDGVKCFAPICKKPKEVFIEQARKIWGDRYDYTDSVYINGKKPIVIYCPKHDYHFRVAMAQNHVLPPHGNTFKPTACPVCQYERQYGKEFGVNWRDFLKLSAKNNRVGLIQPGPKKRPVKTPEQIAAEKAEREAKAEARRREEQAYIDKWKAKNLKEAHFLEKLQSRYPDMYDTHLVDFKDKDSKVTLICPTHGEFRITPRQLFGDRKHKAHGCWKCAGLEDPDDRPSPMTADEFFQRMHQLYDATELDFTTSEYRGRQNRVTAYCRKHGKISHPASYWLSGKGCEYCNGKFYPPDFERLARVAQGEDYIYKGVENINTRSDRVMVHCGNPAHEWHEMLVWLCLQGSKCRECAGRHQSVEQRCQEWIEKSDKKYRGEFDYSEAPADYVNNDSKVWLTHKPCGTRFQITPDTHLRGVNGGCPFCNVMFLESEGERVVRLWLEDHHINHDLQHILPNEDPTLPLQYLKTDFWLDDFDGQPLVIEYNGEQHYEYTPLYYKDRRRDFGVQQLRDRYLRRYCHDQGYRLLEIPYWEFDHIDSILTSVLLNHEPIPTFEQPKVD